MNREEALSALATLHDLIPAGCYCHDADMKPCPFWAMRADKPHQENGFCYYIDMGDWEFKNWSGLLFDQCKECGIKEDE